MSNYTRPCITWGNSFTLSIDMKRAMEGEYVNFDLTKATELSVTLVCATHNTIIPLDYEIVDEHILSCFVDYRLLHPNTSYGVTVEGDYEDGMHFRWAMLPREGIVIIPNTSGMKLPDNTTTIDLQGRVGFVGVAGPQGVTGVTGPAGEDGKDGEAGPEGPQGVTGLKGQDGTVEFDDLTPEQKAELKGETGPQGVTGLQGIQGEQGVTGASGPAGEDGETGPQGVTGIAGTTDYNELENKPTFKTVEGQEIIGTGDISVDLSDYYTSDEVDVIVSDVEDKVDLLAEASAKQTDIIKIELANTIEDVDDKLEEMSDDIDGQLDSFGADIDTSNLTTAQALNDLDKRIGYFEKEHYYENQYLTFEVLQSTAFRLQNVVPCYYSLDDGATWIMIRGGGSTPVVQAGHKIMWKGNGGTAYFYGMTVTGNFNVSGNVMSLLYGDNFKGQTVIEENATLSWLFKDITYLISAENLILPATTLSMECYGSMFENCTNLIAAPKLPATKMRHGCYGSMFAGCTSLTTAPELPATSLQNGCYYGMFAGCTSLTIAPELPASTLYDQSYRGMFYGCSNLNFIKCLATNISATHCTTDWVNGVSQTGSFVQANNTTWTTGNNGIPTGWDVYDEDDWSYVRHYELGGSSKPIYYVYFDMQRWTAASGGIDGIWIKKIQLWDLSTQTLVQNWNINTQYAVISVFDELNSSYNISNNIKIDGTSTSQSNLQFTVRNGSYVLLNIPQANNMGYGSTMIIDFYVKENNTVTGMCNSIIIPFMEGHGTAVTSSQYLKIQVVSSMPASPAADTIYIVQ